MLARRDARAPLPGVSARATELRCSRTAARPPRKGVSPIVPADGGRPSQVPGGTADRAAAPATRSRVRREPPTPRPVRRLAWGGS
ncbi:unnamed protein product [Lampetra planeri]